MSRRPHTRAAIVQPDRSLAMIQHWQSFFEAHDAIVHIEGSLAGSIAYKARIREFNLLRRRLAGIMVRLEADMAAEARALRD